MEMVNVNEQPTGRLTAKVSWLEGWWLPALF